MKEPTSIRYLYMANINRIFSSCFLGLLAIIASPGRAEIFCNPVVDPLASDTTLVRTLSRIAEEYKFKLSLPESLDHPVGFKKSMTLERLVKHLTRNMNTVLKHKTVAGCASPILTHLIVLPVGQETEHVSSQQLTEEQTLDYIYIDDMESYVTNVLNGSQQVDLRRMTPEQREEFRIVREALTLQADEEASQTDQLNITEVNDPDNADKTSAETPGN
jgi:hypothetical protein